MKSKTSNPPENRWVLQLKRLKIITDIMAVISALLTLLMPIISSAMQGFYKASINSFSNTEKLLANKQLWGQMGETPIFLIAFLVCICVFIFVSILKNKHDRNF